MEILDRRLNPKGRSLPNRQRFLRRAKGILKDQIARDGSLGNRSLNDQGGHEVEIPLDSLGEPRFHHGSDGVRDHVLPGNKQYKVGDTIDRPKGGKGQSGSQGSPDGDGMDSFRFVLTREEFLDLFLEDLELPDLAKQALKDTKNVSFVRAGLQTTGTPAALDVQRTMRNGLGRRIALRRPKPEDLKALEAEIEELRDKDDAVSKARLSEVEEQLARVQNRMRAIPWADPVDTRYRRFEEKPKPQAQAVMFCLMDVSGSMTENMKDLAKRFYTLLKLFLDRKYEKVELVFIRHTQEAEAVNEQEFFHGQQTGGTMVSSALREMQRLIKEKYSPAEWNIYAAQASDGDNYAHDGVKCTGLLRTILPDCQYFAYIEVKSARTMGGLAVERPSTELWRTYEPIADQSGGRMVMRKISDRKEIYPVFRGLFEKRAATHSVTAAFAPSPA